MMMLLLLIRDHFVIQLVVQLLFYLAFWPSSCSGLPEGSSNHHQHRTGYACEGSSLTISCDEPYHINLIRANFGRFSISICNPHGNLEWSVNCKSPESFGNIQRNCNRKTRCLLPASSAFFGDPCPGTYKYLEVHYECVPKILRPGGSNDVVRSPSSSSSSSSSSDTLSSLSSPSFSSFPSHSLPSSSSSSQPGQSLATKPKNQSPPPIIIPTINPSRTSSPHNAHSPSSFDSGLTSSSPSPANDFGFGPSISILHESSSLSPPSLHQPPSPISMTNQPNNGDRSRDAIYVPHPYPRSTTIRPDPWGLSNYDDSSASSDTNGQSAQYAGSGIQESLMSDHCLPGFVRDLHWNYTEVGQTAVQSCPAGSKGRAIWMCVRQGGIPQWVPPKPDFSDCHSLWMINLENRLLRGDAVVGIAAEFEAKTRSQTLYGGDVYRATEIINQLILKMESVIEQFPDQRQRNQIIKELLISIQDSCSNLLRKNHKDSWIELRPNNRKEAATTLVYTLEKTSLLLADTKNAASDYIRAHDYIYLAIHTRDAKDLIDYPGKLSLPLPPNSEDSETSLDHAYYSHFIGNAVELSSEAIFDLGLTTGFIRIFVVMFKRLDTILEPEYYKPPPSSLDDGILKILNSDIIGTTLSLAGSVVRLPYRSLRTGSIWIKIAFRHLLIQNVTNPQCVYWDPEKLNWSTKGSYLVLSNSTHTLCEYDHLGYFGLIMDHIESSIETNGQPGSFNDGNLSSYLENEGTIRVLLILGSTLNSIVLLIALVTLVLVRSLQTKESALIHKNVTINVLLNQLVLLLILGTYLSPNYFVPTSSSSTTNHLFASNSSTIGSLGLLVALYHYFLLVHFVWILFDLVELYLRLSRKQFVDPIVSGSSPGPVTPGSSATAASSASSAAAVMLTKSIDPRKIRRYFYIISYLIPFAVILFISWSTSSSTVPIFANLCLLEARSHLASFVIASSIILTALGLLLLWVTYSRISLQATAAAASAASPASTFAASAYPAGMMTPADKFALDLMLNRKLKISLFFRFSLNLLAAINCTLGVVYLTYRVSTIGYLFALTNLTLGLFVFAYYCLTKENIRARYSLLCSHLARQIACHKSDHKSGYMDNSHHHHHHHPHHSNVIHHHLPLNGGLTDGLPSGIVVPSYSKNPSIPNLTGNPAQLSEPIINSSTSMGALSSMARELSASKHYLTSDGTATESGSDYGCRRLTVAAAAAAAAAAAGTHGPTPNHFYHLYNPKQPCNPYSCHHMIEHVYECIDDEPYVAKVLLPSGSAVASATLGNYRLHPLAAHHHGQHLHHLQHFQPSSVPNHLAYHNLDTLRTGGSQAIFEANRPSINIGSSTTFHGDRNVDGLHRCLVSTPISAKRAGTTTITANPGGTGLATGSQQLSTSGATLPIITSEAQQQSSALPAIVSDNSGRRTIICSKSSSNLNNDGNDVGSLTCGSTLAAGTLGGNNSEITTTHSSVGGASVLAVLSSNNRVISSCTASQQQGINI